MMKSALLLIDDDVELAELLEQYLGGEGYALDRVHDGEQGLRTALEGRHDLVLLDVMMPKMDGLEVLSRLRESSSVPVLMLTARGDAASRVTGLKAGADDYLPKPFDPEELLLRIEAILRRSKGRDAAMAADAAVEASGIRVDPGSRGVWRGGEAVELTTIEYDILETLIRRAGHVVSRDDLMQRLYQRVATPFDRSIDVHISHLRKKLERGQAVIRTVRGVGYQFVTESGSRAE